MTPHQIYTEQRGIFLAAQLIFLLCVFIKYLFPGKMRNTHSKVLAFMFVLQSLNMYKNKRESEKTYGEFGFYVVLLLSLG